MGWDEGTPWDSTGLWSGPPSPSPFSVPPCQVSPQKARKKTVRAFWSQPPEACRYWGSQREGGRGRRKAEKKAEARQRAPSTFEAVSNPSEGGAGVGRRAGLAGRQSRVLKNVSNSCGNQRDCKSPLPNTPPSQPPPQPPPKVQSSTPGGPPTLCPQVIAGCCPR